MNVSEHKHQNDMNSNNCRQHQKVPFASTTTVGVVHPALYTHVVNSSFLCVIPVRPRLVSAPSITTYGTHTKQGARSTNPCVFSTVSVLLAGQWSTAR